MIAKFIIWGDIKIEVDVYGPVLDDHNIPEDKKIEMEFGIKNSNYNEIVI